MPMTNRPELTPLLLSLLTASSLASSSVGVGSGNITTPTDTQQGGGEATPHTGPATASSRAPIQTSSAVTLNKEGLDGGHTMFQNASEMVTSQHPTRSETSENSPPSTGNERFSSLAGTSAPTLPVRNRSPGSVSPPGTSATMASISAIAKKVTPNHVTHSTATVATTPKTATDGSSRQRTTGQQAIERNTAMSVQSTQTPTTSTTSGVNSHICSTATPKRENLVGRCLIAISLLAALATIFIMTTIILATKLASPRYRNQTRLFDQLDTEMVCISRVVNGDSTDRPVPKPRRPRSNGALIPNVEDEDGDDLTLNSFLPDMECAA